MVYRIMKKAFSPALIQQLQAIKHYKFCANFVFLEQKTSFLIRTNQVVKIMSYIIVTINVNSNLKYSVLKLKSYVVRNNFIYFFPDEGMKSYENINLIFGGIDTFNELTMHMVQLNASSNMFIRQIFSIEKYYGVSIDFKIKTLFHYLNKYLVFYVENKF